jgi:hypothetical protein
VFLDPVQFTLLLAASTVKLSAAILPFVKEIKEIDATINAKENMIFFIPVLFFIN